MNERLVRFTKLVLDFMFYSGWIVFFTLPLSLKFLGKYYSGIINEYFPRDDEDCDTGFLFCI